MLVEHSVGSNTNNAWTPPQTVHSRHVATKPLWRWGGLAHGIVFMTLLYLYYAPSFVLVEHSVCHEPIFFKCIIYIIYMQGRSEGTSSGAFEVLIINCETDFINLFVFNCLTSNINLFIFKCLTSNINLFIFKCLTSNIDLFNFNCLTSNFCFQKNISFASRRKRLFMDVRP